MAKKIIFSGIQPTGVIHIGNYLGAIKQWIPLQKDNQCIFCIVDLHAITVPYNPNELQDLIFKTAATYLACGVDPDKSIIFVQSQVPEHTELAWLLNTITPITELERMTQFKEKAEQHRQSINAGLLNYPVLMAADILLYKALGVPVGEDQAQHVEITRTIARKFNNTFGEVFPIPKVILSQGARVMGLDNPAKKMSKSYGPQNYLALTDDEETIWQKISVAMTDPARKKKTDKGDPDKCNLYSLHQLFSDKKTQQEVAEKCKNAKWGCLDCKKVLAENINKEIKPIRDKIKNLENNPDEVTDILEKGTVAARKMAQEMIGEVRKIMGLI